MMANITVSFELTSSGYPEDINAHTNTPTSTNKRTFRSRRAAKPRFYTRKTTP